MVLKLIAKQEYNTAQIGPTIHPGGWKNGSYAESNVIAFATTITFELGFLIPCSRRAISLGRLDNSVECSQVHLEQGSLEQASLRSRSVLGLQPLVQAAQQVVEPLEQPQPQEQRKWLLVVAPQVERRSLAQRLLKRLVVH
jgi:hypothetical protein